MASAPSEAATTRVDETTVETAISALLKYKANQSSSEKLQLLPQDDYVYLNLTLKKIPSNSRTNPFRIPLPHPILDPTSELCLIIDDRPQTPTPPSDQIKKLIKSDNIPISKVIKLSKLKTNYKPFEAKRKLCDSYDMFFVDKRIVHLLPKLIGKEFFKKKKLPLGVDLSKKNLKLQVERALGSALLYLRSGTCCVTKVGKVAMEKDEIVENVVDAIKGAVEMVPKKWDGVRSLHLKFSDSVALPLYQAMPDVKLKIEGVETTEKKALKAKASDSEGEAKETSGSKVGKSGKKNKKGRIHEVRYMDVEDGIDGDDVDLDGNELVKDDEFAGQVIIGGNMIDESDDEKTVGKKRKVSGEKKEKKKAKVEKSSEKKPTETDGMEFGEKKPKKKSSAKKPNETDAMESREKKAMNKSKKSAAKIIDVVESAEKKGKKKSELGKKLNEGVAKVKDVKQKKSVSFK